MLSMILDYGLPERVLRQRPKAASVRLSTIHNSKVVQKYRTVLNFHDTVVLSFLTELITPLHRSDSSAAASTSLTLHNNLESQTEVYSTL